MDIEKIQFLHEKCTGFMSAISQVIQGKDDLVRLVTSSILANGHILIEDLPGLGKTTLAKTIASLISSNNNDHVLFSRIQFTPDLLPYDITGVEIFNQDRHCFEFQKGPVFTNILLADEINRTNPKVQAALLEVMAERQVSIGGVSHAVPKLFFVIATQNPIEVEGTYPLPVAQLDRFLVQLKIGYPDFLIEKKIVKEDPSLNILPSLKPVIETSELETLQEYCQSIFCHDDLIELAVKIGRKTRKHNSIRYGVSPRGCLMLVHLAKAHAFLDKREFVSDQDILKLTPYVFSHRIQTIDTAINKFQLIQEITENVKI